MGFEVFKTAIAHRAVQWGRSYNKDFDMAVFVNDHIGGAIISNGIYEKDFLDMTTKVLTELMQGTGFKAGICLDVGANIGNHSIFYSTIFSRVIAFEPNPIAYKLLQANVLKNNILNVEIITAGLGAESQQKKLFVCSKNLGMSSLVEQEISTNLELSFDITIEAGDNLINKFVVGDSFISFIKIDVEGFEADTLMGLQKTIAKHLPVIAIELNFSSNNARARAALSKLINMGYKDFYVTESSHKIKNRYINFLYRVFFGDKKIISKLLRFEEMDYQIVYCKHSSLS